MSEVSSGITKRTIFACRRGVNPGEPKGESVFRFANFARVVTPIGVMWEPFTINDMWMLGEQMPTNHDPTDMMRRIDEIEGFGQAKSSRIFGHPTGERPVHSLDQWVYAGP